MQTLSGRTVMIVEDDYFLACELADHFRSADAKVLGPFPSVSEASGHVENADLAVLDVNLRDQKVYPLADLLMDAAVPFVFYSANRISEIPRRFAHIARLPKPGEGGSTVALLQSQLYSQALLSLLPKLRLSARLILADPVAADRLVEATLELALAEHSTLSSVPPLEKWLQQLMERARTARARDLMN